MRQYTRRDALKLFGAGAVVMAGMGLAGCSGSGSDAGASGGSDGAGTSGKPGEPMPASQAFAQQGVWMQCRSGDIPEKDTTVVSVLVFDGSGNVTRYETDYIGVNERTSYEELKFGDLDGLSNDEIIALAAQKDRDRFDALKQSSINETSESLDTFKKDADFYQDNIANADEGQKVNEAAEYKEPEAVPFALAVETDGAGNNTASETLSFESESLNAKYFYAGAKIGSAPDSVDGGELYKAEKVSIELEVTGTQTVYDTLFGGYSKLYTVVNTWDSIYELDTPDTEGIEVD